MPAREGRERRRSTGKSEEWFRWPQYLTSNVPPRAVSVERLLGIFAAVIGFCHGWTVIDFFLSFFLKLFGSSVIRTLEKIRGGKGLPRQLQATAQRG